MKNFNQLDKKKQLQIYFSSIKTKVAIKFPKKNFLFFLPKIGFVLKGLIILPTSKTISNNCSDMFYVLGHFLNKL